MNSVTVLPTAREVWVKPLPPTAFAIVTVEPMASPTIITVSICITCPPTETAVMLSTPLNWPMMNKSAIP